jgi:PKD repeat protein
MNFGYQNYTAYSLFNFIPRSPAYEIFTNNEKDPNILQIVYNGEDYKTIGSLIEFGSLIDGEPPSKKNTLMRRYLDFFDVAEAGPKALFHCSRNSVCRWHTVDFTDDSYDNIISWQWEFPGGTPSSSTERNPSVYYIDAGNYDVKLTVSDGTKTRSILKKEFITVNVCAGSPDLHSRQGLTVYPNPSNSMIRIKFSGTILPKAQLFIYDLMGRKVLERQVNNGIRLEDIQVDVSSLPKGLYLIKIISGSVNEAAKLIIE